MDNYNSISTPPAYKFNTIQFFRFIAALMVLVYHATLYTSQRLIPVTIYDQGFYGVNLFFAISGFVMIISSENLLEKPGGWRIFATKRIIRIVPIYWIITICKVILILVATSLILHTSLNAGFITKSFFFIPARDSDGILAPFYGVGWTLNFEMFFYLLFTIALALRVRPIIFLSIIFIALTILSVYKTPQWPDVSFYADPIVLNFLYGMIAAKLILNNIKLPKKLAAPVVLLCLLYLFLPKTGGFPGFFANNIIILSIALFLIVYGGASVESSWGAKIPVWLIYLGGASYSLYLVHPSIAPAVPAVLKILNFKWAWLSIAFSALASIGAGTLFYKFCEKPTTQFFSKLARRLKLI